MSKVVLDDVISGYGLSKINENFQKIEDELNNKVLYRDNPVDEINTIEQDLDLNGFSLYNVEKINNVAVDTFTANVDVVAGSIASVNTVATNIDNVNIVAGIDEDITDVAAVADDVALLAPYAPDVSAYTTGIYNNLASEDADKGASLVGYRGGEDVKDALDARLPEIGSYALLRAYTGPATAFQVRGVANVFDGGFGIFRVSAGDTISPDNGGTILVDAAGRRWKRDFNGLVNAAWFDMPSGTAAAINAAASVCRATGVGLKIPPVATYHTISATVDLSDIYIIDAVGAELRGTFSGSPAAIIGGTSSGFRGAEIYLKVRNTTDGSKVSGTKGIKFLSFSNSRLTLFARGFDEGLYFDGASANRVWVDNEFRILELYNNGSHVHFDMSGLSYAVKNQFIGGSWFKGDVVTAAGRGTVKLTLSGSGLVSDILVQSPEIGLVRTALDLTDHAVFVYADVGTTWDINTIEFKDARVEGYGTWGSDTPYGINIATNASGHLGVEVELTGSFPYDAAYGKFQIATPPSKNNKVRLINRAIRSVGDTAYPQRVIPNKIIPYQTASRCYVPGRVIYDQTTGYLAHQDYFSTAFGSNSISRANGDGDIISGAGTDTFGLMYNKTVGEVSFLELHTPEQFAVVCFDASGNVLSGAAPYYAVGAGGRSITRGSVGIYECNGRWLWLHKDVAYFYIGAARWVSNGHLRDISFDVTFGSPVRQKNDTKMSPATLVAHTAPTQSVLPVGTRLDGTTSQSSGWVSTFSLRTTASSGAASGATAIDLSTVTGIAANDIIGIELDSEIATGLRKYQWTTVSSVAGSTVNLGAALAANVAAGRAVLVGRWEFECVSGFATYDAPSLADGTGTTTTVTVTGAAIGDYAVASMNVDLQGVIVTAWVSAANTVSVRLQNGTGGTVDLGSATLRARVFKR